MKHVILFVSLSLFLMLASCDKDTPMDWDTPTSVCVDEAVGDYSTDKSVADAYTFSLIKNDKGGNDDYFCGGDRYCGTYGSHQRDQRDASALKVVVNRLDESNKKVQYILKGHLEDACTELELPEQKTDGHTWEGEFSRLEDQLSGTLYMDGNPIVLNLTKIHGDVSGD